MRDVKTINERLREYQTKWYKEIVRPWVEGGGGKSIGLFSQPFFTGIYECSETKPLVMFVGQETNKWGYWEDFDGESEIPSSQKFVMDFTENNTLTKCKRKTTLYKGKECSIYDSSPFWTFIRNVINPSIQVVWNELDKIHYRTAENKCIKLCVNDELQLNESIKDGKSLLQLEIETIQPQMVIFLTGPNYAKSMGSALNNGSLQKTCKDYPVINFDFDKIPCLWTYHPGGLNRLGLNLKMDVEEIIKKEINSLL